MPLYILSNHIFCNLSRAESTLSNSPKMTAPIPFPQMREFLLECTRRPPFQSLHESTHRQPGRIRDREMHRVLAYYSLDDFYIVSRTGLSNQCPQSFPYILGEYLIAILRVSILDEPSDRKRHGVQASLGLITKILKPLD